MKPQLTCLFLLLAAPLLHAQSTPSLMSYQGRVTDAAGVLIGNSSPASRTVTFQLYKDPSGGTALYAETQTVTISGGEFSVLIGNGTGISGRPGPGSPATQPYQSLSEIINSGTYGSLYLGVTVDDGTTAADLEISPRQQIVSGAFALRAKVAENVAAGAVSTAMMGDGQVTNSKIASGAVDSNRIADSSIVANDIANNTITAGKLDFNSIGLWSPVGSSVYRGSGNVGIGEANPGFPLNFAASLGDKISLYANSGSHYGFGIQPGLLQIHSDAAGADIAFGYGRSASFNETMRIKGNGYVGIGTANPSQKLDIAGGLSASSYVFAPGYSFNGGGDTDGGMYSNADGVVQFRTNGAERMRINGNGNIGIGTSDPTRKLSIQDGGLWFTTTTGNGDDSGVGGTMAVNDAWRIFGAGDNNDGALFIDTYDDANEPIVFRQTGYERMRIASNGRVGIGTNNPRCTLEVSGWGDMTYSNQSFLNKGGAGDFNSTVTAGVSIYASDRIVTESEFNTSSDSRIKMDLKVTDSAQDLDTLCAIEVTDYHLKDSISRGTKLHKKVIAQQLETVYPQAVNREVGVVPDIYQLAPIKDGWIELATDLKVGEQVRLIATKGPGLHKVLEVHAGAFLVESCPDEDKVFVYGRQVDDFRMVDYDAIAMLNVSATQEIKREKDAEINALKTKNAELEARLSALEKLSAAK